MNIKKLFDLSGRVAIITGGSVGLGRQMAEGLAEMGANLVLCARKKERCLQAAGGTGKTRALRFLRLAAMSKIPPAFKRWPTPRSSNLGASTS